MNPFRLGARDYDLNPFIHPRALRTGYAGHVVDDHGVDYVDFLSAWGANILGYGYGPVARAAARQAKRFSGLGLPYEELHELMALLGKVIPCAEAIRFGKNGSDVTAAAVRLARAVTGREKVVFRGFHGFHDWYMASTECRGIPAGLRPLMVPLAELTPAAVDETLSRHKGEVACVIVNPLVPEIPVANAVREIIEVAHRHGALVVFDEMISGFRVALAGMQEVWGVEPDLACFGKAIANGLPLSVLAGKARFMDAMPRINYGITFEGEAVSIAAAHETLSEIRERGVIPALAQMGRRIKADFSMAASGHGVDAIAAGPDAAPGFWFGDAPGVSARELHWLFIQELTRDRIFTLGSFNLCYRHTRSDLERLAWSFRRSFGVLRECIERRSARGLLDERVRAAIGKVQTPEDWRGFGVASGEDVAPTYKTFWESSSSDEESALASTYVAQDEIDYRSGGWNGDANSFGARQLIELAALDRSSTVLEVGCGTARIGREMAPHVGEWHGADIARGMLDLARKRTAGLPNVFLHELDDVGLRPFADSSFDFVYITTVLPQLDREDVYQYLLDAHRVLKPSGMAFFDAWNLLHPDMFRLWRSVQAANVGSGKPRGRLQFTTAVEMRRYLDEVGFTIVRFDEGRLIRALCRRDPVSSHVPDDGHPPFGYVDAPANGSGHRETLGVWGWALDTVESVEIFIDGARSLGMAILGRPRPDVAPLFPRYPLAGVSGFELEAALAGIEPGPHTLQVIARDLNGCETDLCGNHRGLIVEA